MLEFDGVQSHVMVRCLERFRDRVQHEIAEVVARELRGFLPAQLRELLEELDVMLRQLSVGPNLKNHSPSDAWPNTVVHDVHARMIKRVVVAQRRALAREIDGPRQKTTHREAIGWLEREIRILDQLLALEWMTATRSAVIPKLTDFLTIRHAEALTIDPEGPPTPSTDDNFHILAAASSFADDLARLRARCELRELPIALVYLDLDDFKQFNSRYGETRVDRDLLSPFMELLEAHAFARGTAYRMGGDEYVVILPNCDGPGATSFTAKFSAALRELRCPGIDPRPTVSSGVVEIGVDCALTEREALARADRAKAFAKQAGKDCTAGYDHELMREGDLRIRPR